ncbi:MAG: adenylosuccinate lyase family protein [Acetobacteraceae bacterium]|nr:adenylosuccinate lyase family protein [Acetobacteraceae bacterium]
MPVSPLDSPVFGTLFGSDAMRALFDERAWLQRMLDVEAALARVQSRLGIIPEGAGAAITAAARIEHLDTHELARSVRDSGYPVVGVTKGLSRAAGEAGGFVHWGATTQDIMDSATALQLRDALALLRADIVRLIGVLVRQAERHRDTLMAGRTYLQHAIPTTLGRRVIGWLLPFLAHIERLDQLRPRATFVQFGGAVGTLASLGERGVAVMQGLAAELGLGEPAAPWHVSRDGFAEAVAFCGLLSGSLAKIATDIVLLAQTELGEVGEPHVPGRGGSSTMPQKRNPITSAYVIAASRAVQAQVPLMLGAMNQAHDRGAGDWQAEPLAIGQSFVLTHGALLHTLDIADGMAVDAARMRRNLDSTGGLIVAEAVMMRLAPKLGRAEAHHAVQHACERALAEGIPLATALGSEPELAGKLDRLEIERATDPAGYLGSTQAFIDRVLERARTVF